MIKLIVLITTCYLIVGGIGMAVGNRGHSRKEQLHRWLKFFTYVLISTVVIASIYFEIMYIASAIIVAVGFYELLRQRQVNVAHYINAIAVYIILATGFVLFCWHLNKFQQLFIYFQVFTFDAFSQISGQAFGKHKLIPKISPGKTIEGLVGGVIFCCLSSILARQLLQAGEWMSFVLGLLTSLTALSGDLLASFYKRRVGVKDYSSLLPGQGGFLDRFDSLILTAAVYFVIFSLQ